MNNKARKTACRFGALIVSLLCATATLAGVARAQVQTGFLQICKEADGANVSGTFGFTVSGLPGTFRAPVGSCAGLIELPAGEVTVTEAGVAGFTLTGVRTVPFERLVGTDLAGLQARVRIVAGDSSSQTIVFFRNAVVGTPTTTTTTSTTTTTTGPGTTTTTIAGGTGGIQFCKEAEGAGVTGTFDFTVTGRPGFATVGVGQCSEVFPVAAGTQRVTELARPGFHVVFVYTDPADRLLGFNAAAREADVAIVADRTTRVVFRNAADQGQIKVCKIAGPGVAEGTQFTFAFGGGFLTVPAGPASQNGFCTFDGHFPVGTTLTIVETVPAGMQVSSIAVLPSDRLVGVPDLANAQVTIRVGGGVNEVVFTNQAVNGTTTTTTTTTTTQPTTTTTRPTTTTTTTRPSVCAFTQGYFKTHEKVVSQLLAPLGGKLTIGGVALTAAQIDTILERSSSNYLNALLQQLIAARLNQLRGASTPPAVASAIAAANALVAQQGGPLTGTATSATTVTFNGVKYTASQLNDILTAFNEGTSPGGPRSCG